MTQKISSVSHDRRHTRPSRLIVAAAVLASLIPALAFAHAVVYPKKSTTGAYERYVLRVPNEKTTITTRVEIHFPESAHIVAFADVPGWQLQVLTDSAKRIVGAVWTGSLPPARFVEFPFMVANPKTATDLVWPVYQTYGDGDRVEWTGNEGSRFPASVTNIAAPDSAGATPTDGSRQWVQWVALVLALVSLGLVLRPNNSAP